MNIFYVVIYLVSLCLLVGCGFAMMYANLKSIQEDMDKPIKRRTERPEPPKSVVYVDSSTEATRKRLEDLYND
jgi:hypothetical protein